MGTPPPTGTSPTHRELAALRAYAEHESYQRAAVALGLSTTTIRTHLVNVRSRLGARTTAGAIARAARAGLL